MTTNESIWRLTRVRCHGIHGVPCIHVIGIVLIKIEVVEIGLAGFVSLLISDIDLACVSKAINSIP